MSMNVSVQHWVKSDVGLKRESNQDSYRVNESIGLYVVADGMGGHSGGEVASAIAVETAEDVTKRGVEAKLHPTEIIANVYEEASRRIFDKAAREPELLGMGTTMVMALVSDFRIYVASVGDSRVYLFAKPYMWQITEDHSLVNDQLRAGLLTEEQSKNYLGRNYITRSVGYERDVTPDILEREVVEGEMYLLCSDGLHGMAPDNKLSDIFNKWNGGDIAKTFIDAALAGGGDDNVTSLVFQIQGRAS